MPLDLDEKQEWKNNAGKMVELTHVFYKELCRTDMPDEVINELVQIWFGSMMNAITMPAFPDFSSLFKIETEEEEEDG